MAQPWYDDVEGESYKGAYVIPEDLADTLDDFGQGHYLDTDKTYSRPEYAYRAGIKIIPPNYFLLVRIELPNDRIGWMVMITREDTNEMFERME